MRTSWKAVSVLAVGLAALLVIPVMNTTIGTGAQDSSCRPTSNHQRPVLLLHGTGGSHSEWDSLSAALKVQGYCVFAPNYGGSASSLFGIIPGKFGTDNIEKSAEHVAEYTHQILTSTGATQIDIVGHSQGGTLARQFMRFNGGTNQDNPEENIVHSLITLGATNHGTTVNGLAALVAGKPVVETLSSLVASPAAVEQLAGSSFIRRLNEAGDTDPGVIYTSIATKYDNVSTPPEATFLNAGPNSVVNNMFVQDFCPTNKADHKTMLSDRTVEYLVQEALAEVREMGHPVPCPSTHVQLPMGEHPDFS
ncbi:alpha/beta fold hydrolase [Rhodococcus erythropolis]|uniref:esterase/lipase family protein n=1 Tax=Rhodococcus erythropolis TaxID=1833 RepID=UPI002949E746|nr:alpha/beta fold hydrolase [Rhodococcus erythropolis]MDV6278321.1 alpha/beta fold hydrolase [Rhodococcus erythropolis]